MGTGGRPYASKTRQAARAQVFAGRTKNGKAVRETGPRAEYLAALNAGAPKSTLGPLRAKMLAAQQMNRRRGA